VEVVAGARRRAYRAKARNDPSHVAHSRATSQQQTRLTDDTLAEASTEGWETKEDTRHPELWMPRSRLHALLADRTGHGHFADYHARFGHDEETVREAVCACGKPLAPTPCDCPILAGVVRPPLYGHTKGWLRRVNDYYRERSELRQRARTLVEQGHTWQERVVQAWPRTVGPRPKERRTDRLINKRKEDDTTVDPLGSTVPEEWKGHFLDKGEG